jgi:hypothetical protein
VVLDRGSVLTTACTAEPTTDAEPRGHRLADGPAKAAARPQFGLKTSRIFICDLRQEESLDRGLTFVEANSRLG